MTAMRSLVVLFMLLALSAGCANVQPLTSSENNFAQDEDEQKLLRNAAQLSNEIRSHGLVLSEEVVDSYVQAVAERVIPAAISPAIQIKIRVIRDPVVNAFALPNGDIYLTIGLLARLDNEAQLAHVISHEVAHVVQRHGLQQMRGRKSSIIAAHIADIALFGTSIAYLPFAASIASYSRDQEKEADLFALSYMSSAGYPLDSAYQLFALLEEVKSAESIKGSIFGSHPANKLRAQYTQERIASHDLQLNADGDLGEQRYQAMRAGLIVENIRLKLNIKQYQLALDTAERALEQAPGEPQLHCYRGEALRLMAEDPEGAARESAWINNTDKDTGLIDSFRRQKASLNQSAKQAYQQALSIEPGFALAYRGLGLVAYAEGDSLAAREALSYYLANGRDISDRRYIKNLLEKLTTP